MEYYQQETVKVELDDEGNHSFFFYGRDGREDLGPEIRLAADTYNIGTLIELREAIEDKANDR